MTAQDVFPKIDGDVLYHSEVNRFAAAGRSVEIGSTAIHTAGSATAYATIGSVVIAAGNLSNPGQIDVWYRYSQEGVAGKAGDTRLRISGVSTNVSHVLADQSATGVYQFISRTRNKATGHVHILTGSPFLGFMTSQTMYGSGAQLAIVGSAANASRGTTTFGEVEHLNTNAATVLFFDGTHVENGSIQMFYGVQTFRNGTN